MPVGPPGRRLKAREMPTPHAGILGDGASIPTPTGRKPPLGPMEGFILSKTDGRRTISDIGGLAGLSVLEVAVLVARLEELGAVVVRRVAPTEEPGEDDEGEWTIIDEGGPRGTDEG